MKNVAYALIAAFRTLLHPKMLWLLLWPMLAAVVLWLGAAIFFWGNWAVGLAHLVQATPLQQWVAQGFLATVSHYLIDIMLALLLFMAIYVTALVLVAVFAMPLMVSHVAQKYYPGLARKNGGSSAASIRNAAIAVVVYCVGWALSLPLWLFSLLALVLPVMLMAYLNQRLFRYDALAEYASREEYEQVVARSAQRLYLLGVVTGLLQLVPVLNLVLPVYVGLAFIHLCLRELQQLRQLA